MKIKLPEKGDTAAALEDALARADLGYLRVHWHPRLVDNHFILGLTLRARARQVLPAVTVRDLPGVSIEMALNAAMRLLADDLEEMASEIRAASFQ